MFTQSMFRLTIMLLLFMLTVSIVFVLMTRVKGGEGLFIPAFPCADFSCMVQFMLNTIENTIDCILLFSLFHNFYSLTDTLR
ncbi:hypothetical protein BFP72_01790 [Reichenbachiella sp. 5M10]|nr:hypothetical protein BFP72_01790 [Reichenbachiella sp. 5M10]